MIPANRLRPFFFRALLLAMALTIAIFSVVVLWPVCYEHWVVQPLIKKLDDADRQVRMGASSELAEIGPRAVPTLIRELEHASTGQRIEGLVDALGGIGQAAVPELLSMIDSATKTHSCDRSRGVCWNPLIRTRCVMRLIHRNLSATEI